MTVKSPKRITLALELHNADDALLNFTEILNRSLEFSEITALHVLPSNSPVYTPNTQQGKNLKDIYEDLMEEEIDNYLSNRCGSCREFKVKYGEIEDVILDTVNEDKPDLLLIGQSNDKVIHNLSVETVAERVNSDILIVPSECSPQFKKILIPVDFSEDSINAVKRICEMNRSMSNPVEITVLNIPRHIQSEKAEEQSPIESNEFLNTRNESRRSFLRALLNKNCGALAKNIKIEVVNQNTDTIAEKIIRFAENNHFDMIVMGARGHTASTLLLFGSITEDVIKISKKLPVWAVKS